jgi:FxLD family lantipeptide
MNTTDGTIATSDHEFDLDISLFETGTGLAEIIRMTDDGCGSTCESACNSCSD